MVGWEWSGGCGWVGVVGWEWLGGSGRVGVVGWKLLTSPQNSCLGFPFDTL